MDSIEFITEDLKSGQRINMTRQEVLQNRIIQGADFINGLYYIGTKYYEVTMKKVSNHKKLNRYFVPKEKDNFEQELPDAEF